MAFSADELRVLRGALAVALQSAPVPGSDAAAYRQLAEALDEAVREGSRLRSFLLADLARDRAALPGSAAGYLEQLEDALAAGYLPRPDDLAALRLLCADPAGPAETTRRAELLRRGERLAAQAVRARLVVLPGGRSARTGDHPAAPAHEAYADPDGTADAAGGRADRTDGPEDSPDEAPDDPGPDRESEPADAPGESDAPGEGGEPGETGEPEKPGAPPKPGTPGKTKDPEPPKKRPAPKQPPAPAEKPAPTRPVPTPAEVFPPRRRRTEPPQEALLA